MLFAAVVFAVLMVASLALLIAACQSAGAPVTPAWVAKSEDPIIIG